jgi:CBS domain-containing protein
VQVAVASILARGEQPIWTLPPDASVYDAIEMMANQHVGTVLVLDQAALVGILTERDYARKVILQGRSSRDTPVSAVMTSPVVCASPRHSVDDCMSILARHRIRYLPVIEDGRVLRVLSTADLLYEVMNRQDDTIQHLEAYISGQYPR